MQFVVFLLSVCVLALVNLAFFVAGVKIALIIMSGQEARLSILHPIETAKKRKEKKEEKMEAEIEREKLETVLRNIEAYDGTPLRQEDVPER